MALNLILLGPPASGKGTQGRMLARREGLAYLSTGALLREVMAGGGPLSDQIRPILAVGGYIPDEVMCGILREWIELNPSGWVLDGFPRTLVQDDFLTSVLAGNGRRIDGAIALRVPKAELIRRIEKRVECSSCRWSGQLSDLAENASCPECGKGVGRRADDSLDNFLNRHGEYERLTVPVIERYQERGGLIPVDATQSVETVCELIMTSVEKLRKDGEAA